MFSPDVYVNISIYISNMEMQIKNSLKLYKSKVLISKTIWISVTLRKSSDTQNEFSDTIMELILSKICKKCYLSLQIFIKWINATMKLLNNCSIVKWDHLKMYWAVKNIRAKFFTTFPSSVYIDSAHKYSVNVLTVCEWNLLKFFMHALMYW